MRDLNSYVRAEYERPAHGDCHLRMSELTYAGLTMGHAESRPAPVPWALAADAYAAAVATPVIIDDTVPFNRWRLVRHADPTMVIEEGIAMPERDGSQE